LLAVLFCALVSAPPLPAVMSDTIPAAEPPYIEHDELFNMYQPYLHNISAYKPVYFLYGADPADTKFQFSLKYRFISREGLMKRTHRWIRGFHFAYTQTSYWDLDGDSRPFEDTSYKPEVFFLSPNLFSGRGISHSFVQLGYEHESNGQSGDSSRSTNYLYIKPIYVFFHEKTGIGFEAAPRIWAYINNNDNTNNGLYKYRGYFDLEFKVGRADSAVIEAHWWWAEKGHSIVLDLSYPLDQLVRMNLQVYLHAQYANAYAESLINFEERNEALRLGISIIR
jgi:phospholipase A1/A2